MKVTAIKSFPHAELGMFEEGKPVDVSKSDGEYLVSLGLVTAEPYETKVVREAPADDKPKGKARK